MKLIKTFGLAAMATLAAMAFAGASSAMAETTALCDTDPGTGPTEVCPSNHLITHLHEATLAGAQATLLTLISGFPINVKCDVLFLGSTVTPLRAPLLITGSYTYSSCSNNCTVAEENGPAIVEFLKVGHEKAVVLIDFLIHVVCGSLINCLYHNEELPGIAKGRLLSVENTGEVSIQGQELTVEAGSIICPDETFLDIVTAPLSATHITK